MIRKRTKREKEKNLREKKSHVSSYETLWWTKWPWDFFFSRVLRFPPVIIIPPTPHTHLLLHVALTRRTNGRSLGTLQKETLFRKSGSTVSRCVKCSAHESKLTTESIHNYNFTVLLRQFRLPDTSVSWKPAASVRKHYNNNFPTRHWRLSVKVQGVTFHKAISLAFIGARNSYLT
jgi:hypothetical protein